MRKHLEGLDHIVLRVTDLDRAAETYRRLGFVLTPRGVHSVGTRNHCAMLGFDYIELVVVPVGVTLPFFVDFPVAGEGMTGLALKSTNAEAVRSAWARAGLEPAPLLDLRRPVAEAAGAEARFRLVPLPPERTPGGRAFLCEHLTPELVWRPGRPRHPNHVTGINKVVVASDDPAAAGMLWGRVFDVEPFPIPGGASITTGAAPIVVLDPGSLARQLPGVGLPRLLGPAQFAAVYLTTNDLTATAALVRAAGFAAVSLPDGSLAVPASEVHGTVLVFR
jgi:catechol 2,3-dioxygenase-like lactoylglutathione lyase family enzyme